MRRDAVMVTAVGMLVAATACGESQVATPTTTAAPATTAAPTTPVDKTQGVVVENEVPFATFGEITLTLDLYVPADPVGAPIVIDTAYADDLVQEGVIVARIDQGVPDPDVDDIAERHLGNHGAHIRAQAETHVCAIRLARARAAELGSDDPVVVVEGFSEGGGVAAHVALFGSTIEQRWDEFSAAVGGPPRQIECSVAEGSTDVDALVGGAGAYDLYVPAIEGLYGRTFVEEHDPELQQFLAGALGSNPELRVHLIHGTADSAIPMTLSTDFKAALDEAGYDVSLTTFDGGHDLPPPDIGREIYAGILGW